MGEVTNRRKRDRAGETEGNGRNSDTGDGKVGREKEKWEIKSAEERKMTVANKEWREKENVEENGGVRKEG